MAADRPVFAVLEALSHRGGAVNEDAFGVAGPWAWVIDGSTGVGTRRFCPGASDAAWYASELSQALARAAAGAAGATPSVLLERAIGAVAETLRAHLAETGGDWPERVDEPHAAVVLLRADAEGLDYALLGDSALVAPEGGATRLLADPQVEAIDPAFARRIAELRGEGVSDWATIEADIKRRIRGVYETMNTPEGIAVAALDPGAVGRAVTGRVAWPDDGRVLLATDGLLRLVEPFEALDAEALRRAAFDEGLGALIERLRRLEQEDGEALRWPRLKRHDDATALALLRA